MVFVNCPIDRGYSLAAWRKFVTGERKSVRMRGKSVQSGGECSPPRC